MFRRLLRSTIVLAALVAAYQAYVLMAVPLMEPELVVRQNTRPMPIEGDVNPFTPYQLLLKNYFPEGHWTQLHPPKVISSANGQGLFVMDDYERPADNRLDIKRFAFLAFPTPPREGIRPPRDAIILEAPQGAKLQFDSFHPERGDIGQITRGSFPGPITIRSDMHESGPDDDLLVETSDLEMNTKLLYTTSPVRFRMGQNVGSGRELEIRFLVDEHSQPKGKGIHLPAYESLEIRRDVRLRMQLETSSLLPSDEKTPVAKSDLDSKEAARPKPPVDVTCNGPFVFDFVLYRASVDRDVEVRQLNPDGPSDQLTCNQLDIQFAPKRLPGEQDKPAISDPDKRQSRDLGRLEPVAIMAQGHPVVITSPAHNAEARGDRIQIGLKDQRVRIDGGRDAVLIYGDNVLRAPVIDYQHPPRGSGTKIGRFGATGPGTLHYVPDPLKPQQIFRAAWEGSVKLDRDKGQPVLTLVGRPQLGLADAGSLAADQVTMYLREVQQGDGVGMTIAAGAGGNGALRVAPDRIAATGNVEIASSQITGRTERLLATFRVQPASANGAPSGANDQGGLTASPYAPTPGAGASQQAYHIDANQMRMNVLMRGHSAVPADLACDGNVVLREVPLVATEQQPLEIRGGQLTADHLDAGAPHITLRGEAPGEKPGDKLAQLAGRGVTMSVELVEVDGKENRLWSDGPGKATLMVTRDLAGKASPTPFPMDITWQGGLRFDGRAIAFEQEVLVAGMESSLRCDRLTAKLASPIKFGQRMQPTAMELSEIESSGRVLIDSLSRDEVGVTSHERGELRRLAINQQTGAISGDGPGVIRSTRFGPGLAAIAGKQDPAAPNLVSPPPGASGSKLSFLRVDFHRGLTGGIYTKELTFFEHVRTVYGPVDSWEQELDVNQPETLPPDTITLTCDELRINEDPVASRALPTTPSGSRPIGYIQMTASGAVEIAGQVPQQGDFNVQADRASYDQAKETFILEGNTRTPAKLWRRPKPGVVLPPTEARWIRYIKKTGEIKVDGVQFLEITPNDINSARRPSAGTPAK